MEMNSKRDYFGVSTSGELENSFNGKKYRVNRSKNKISITKTLCILLIVGVILLVILAALLTFIFVPKCEKKTVEISEKLTVEEIDPRLPKNIQPEYYKLDLITDIENRTVSGKVRISLEVIEETFDIFLNVRHLEIDENSTELTTINNETIRINKHEYLESERYKITTEISLKKDENYVLVLKFSTKFDEHLQGIYASQYYDEERMKFLANTQFSPIDARRAFPCFDEPNFKSVFGISIARPKNMVAISNMPRKGPPEPFDDGSFFWDHFLDTPPLPTYSVAFVISNFTYKTTSNNIRFWAAPSVVSQTSYAAYLAPKLRNFLENFLNVSFPSDKLDIVALPEFGFSAMENFGLITFRESSLLFDKNNTNVEDEKIIAQILAHEISHQWWGNLATPEFWDDLWLKEGVATHLSYLALNNVLPQWDVLQEILAYEISVAFSRDALHSSRPLTSKIKSNSDIRAKFDAFVYSKSTCLVRMMEHFLTTSTFKEGLHIFLEKFKFGTANHAQFFEVFNDVAANSGNFPNITSVGKVMENWVEKPGIPVISVATHDNGSVTLRQKRFLFNNEKSTTEWTIPISLTTDAETNFKDAYPKFWMTGEYLTIPINYTEWFIINVNQTGYFMVNYDERIWHALIENIMTVPALTRAQLIGDSMELAKAGLLDYDIPLRLISKMATQDKLIMFVPTLIAFEKLEFLSDILVDTPAFGLFENFHMTIFKETYETVDFFNTVEDYLPLRIMKTVLEWSCRSTESRCAVIALNLYRRWMLKGIPIAPNIRQIVYCTAIRKGGKAEWDFAYNAFRKTKSPTEKNVLLDALGCTKEEWLLSRYIKFVLFPETSISMKIQDADRIFESVAKNRAGTRLAFDFLRRNWREIRKQFGHNFNTLNELILTVPKHMNTEFQLAELKKFRDQAGSDVSAALDEAVEIVENKVTWMKTNYKSVEKWLRSHKEHFAL